MVQRRSEAAKDLAQQDLHHLSILPVNQYIYSGVVQFMMQLNEIHFMAALDAFEIMIDISQLAANYNFRNLKLVSAPSYITSGLTGFLALQRRSWLKTMLACFWVFYSGVICVYWQFQMLESHVIAISWLCFLNVFYGSSTIQKPQRLCLI